MKVCVIGLGQVGLPTAEYVKNSGFDVRGYDISRQAIKRAQKHNVTADKDWNKVPLADIYVVCVNTRVKEDKPDVSPVFDACEKIVTLSKMPWLVSIESTVIPGTCRKIYTHIFKKTIAVVHTPHRYWPGDTVRHGVRQFRVMGALDEQGLQKGLRFYQQLKIPLHIAPTIEIAEISKVAENAYRYVQIAFAEELRMICEKLRMNFEEVRKACNTKWNIRILEARDGIGGPCLPMSIKYLISLCERSLLLKSSLDVDEAYRTWLTRKQT